MLEFQSSCLRFFYLVTSRGIPYLSISASRGCFTLCHTRCCQLHLLLMFQTDKLISFSRLYAGQVRNPHPNFHLCVAQSAMVYGSPAMAGVSVFVFIFHVISTVGHRRSTIDCLISDLSNVKGKCPRAYTFSLAQATFRHCKLHFGRRTLMQTDWRH